MRVIHDYWGGLGKLRHGAHMNRARGAAKEAIVMGQGCSNNSTITSKVLIMIRRVLICGRTNKRSIQTISFAKRFSTDSDSFTQKLTRSS